MCDYAMKNDEDDFFCFDEGYCDLFDECDVSQYHTKDKDSFSLSEETHKEKGKIFSIRKMRQSRKAKKEILKQKNKISQKKSRERKKLDIIKLVQENKQLKVKIETISSKLCEKCKKLLNKESNEEKKTQFLLSNTPHMSLPSSAKLLTYFTSIVVIFCLLCNFSPQISFLLKTSLNSNKKLVDKILTSNRLLTAAKNTQNSNLYLNVKQISESQKLPQAGVFMSFGDFYSVTTQNAFLESKYDFINNGKIRVIKDSSYASSIPKKCERCLLEINADNIIRNSENLHFKLFLPSTRFWDKDNQTSKEDNYTIDVTSVDEMLMYEVECEVVGFGSNLIKPYLKREKQQ